MAPTPAAVQSVITKALAFALSKEGVGEHPNGSNHVEVWDRMYPAANKPGVSWAWCAGFGTDAYATGGGFDVRRVFWPYHCSGWRREAARVGAWHPKASGYRPQPGDVVIYGNDDHFGIIRSYAGPGYVNTIEGNTSPNGPSPYTLGIVAKKTRTTAWVSGYVDMHRFITALVSEGKVKIPAPSTTPPPPKRVVSLAALIVAAKHDPSRPQGGTTSGASTYVRIVESALKAEGLLDYRYATDGSFGTKTVKAYSRWQERCGYHGKDADGIPSQTSLIMLGRKYGFTVTT